MHPHVLKTCTAPPGGPGGRNETKKKSGIDREIRCPPKGAGKNLYFPEMENVHKPQLPLWGNLGIKILAGH